MTISALVAGMMIITPAGAEETAARARAVEDARRSLSQSIAAANSEPEPLRVEPADKPPQLEQPLVCLTLNDIAKASARIEKEGPAALYALGSADPLETEAARHARELSLAAAFLAAGFAEEAALAASRNSAGAGLTVARLAALALAPASVAPMHERCGLFDGFSERVGAHARGEAEMAEEDWKVFNMLPPRLRFEIADALASAAVARGDMTDAREIRRTALADAPRTASATTPARLIDALDSNDESSLAALSEIAAQPGALQTRALEELAQRFDKLAPPAQAALADDLSDAAANPAPVHERSSVERSRLRIIEHGLASATLADRMKALSEVTKQPEYFGQLPKALQKTAIADLEALGAKGSLERLGARSNAPANSETVRNAPAKIKTDAKAPRGANLGEAAAFTGSVAEEIALMRAEIKQ